MPTFVILGNYTREGMMKIKEMAERLEAARQLAKSVGGELKDFYLTMGQYDFVALVEGPSIEAATQALLAIGSQGNLRTETLIAIPAKKAIEITKKLP